MNDLCTFCESAFFSVTCLGCFFLRGVRAGECMGMDGGMCVCM